MKVTVTDFTPAWARHAVMSVVLLKHRSFGQCGIFESDLVDECISTLAAFDDLSEDVQHLIIDLLFEAVQALFEEEILLVEEVIFEINPKLHEILNLKRDIVVSPDWGNA